MSRTKCARTSESAGGRRENGRATGVCRHDLRHLVVGEVGTETVTLKYDGPGHTSGDSVTTFQNANVVHMGDLMFHQRHPRVDRGAGASIRNWIVTLESVAKEHPADTIYIAGHAKENLPVTVTRADLLKFRDYFSGLLAFVQKGIASSRPAAEIVKAGDRAGIRRLRGQSRGHYSGGL